MKTIKFLFALLTAMFALAVQAQQGVDDAHRRHMEAFRHNESDLKFQEPSFSHLQAEDSELEMSQYANAESSKHTPAQRIQLSDNTLLCDSTITFKGDGSYSSKTTYTYDENGYKTSEASYYFRQGQWVGNSKKEYAHYQEGNQIIDASASYVWKDGQWVRSSLEEYIYDERENLLQESTWNWENDMWVGVLLSQYTYDERNNKTSRTHYNWSDGKWVGDRSYQEEFDERGNRTYYVTWEWENDEWVTTFMSKAIYDDQGNEIEGTTYDRYDGQLVLSSIYNSCYDGNSKVGEYTCYYWWEDNHWQEKYVHVYREYSQSVERFRWGAVWDDEQESDVEGWLLDGKDEYFYDSSDYQEITGDSTDPSFGDKYICSIHYEWSGEAWKPYYRNDCTYDDHGNKILTTKSYWESDRYGNNGKWGEPINEFKAEYVYDKNDNLICSASYRWEMKTWVGNGEKVEYAYDKNSNKTWEAHYEWNPGKNRWVGRIYKSWGQYYYHAHEYNYDDSGTLTFTVNYAWDSTNDQWIESSKTLGRKSVVSNNERGQKISEVYYTWQDDKWTEDYKYEYTYEEQGNHTLTIYYTWQDDKWTENYKYEYTYDEQGNKTLDVYYKWQDGQWVVSTKTVYYYLDELKKEYSMKVLNKVVDILVGKESVEEEEMEKVDINGDGVISIGDVARVIYFLINEEDDEDEDKDKDKKE